MKYHIVALMPNIWWTLHITINIRAPTSLFQVWFGRGMNLAVAANNFYFSILNPTCPPQLQAFWLTCENSAKVGSESIGTCPNSSWHTSLLVWNSLHHCTIIAKLVFNQSIKVIVVTCYCKVVLRLRSEKGFRSMSNILGGVENPKGKSCQKITWR